MANTSYAELSLNGLWKNNPAIVQLLGLCPLLAVTGSVVNAIGLGRDNILRVPRRAAFAGDCRHALHELCQP